MHKHDFSSHLRPNFVTFRARQKAQHKLPRSSATTSVTSQRTHRIEQAHRFVRIASLDYWGMNISNPHTRRCVWAICPHNIHIRLCYLPIIGLCDHWMCNSMPNLFSNRHHREVTIIRRHFPRWARSLLGTLHLYRTCIRYYTLLYI